MGKWAWVFALCSIGAGAYVSGACSSESEANVGGSGAGGAAGGDGSSGSSGAGASAGSGGSGLSGGSAGSTPDSGSGCKSDAECSAKLPTTIPASCATGKCQANGECAFAAIDGDGDGHAKSQCKASDGSITIELGDDCDDADPNTNPAAWDGPAGEGQADRCDGLDQDCNGTPDDNKLTDGTSCTCKPGDIQQCSEDSQGKPITWPTGAPVGACKYGGRTCLTDGTWGPCTDAVPPMPADDCNVAGGLDTTCDGKIDCACTPLDATKPCENQNGICSGGKYTCLQTGWSGCDKLPGTEICNGQDDDCNGTKDDVAGLGKPCNVEGSMVGACYEGGTNVCGASQLECQKNDPNIGSGASYKTYAAPTAHGGEWNWNCMNGVEKSPAENDFYQWDSGCDGLYWVSKLYQACQSAFYDADHCNGGFAYPYSGYVNFACDPGSGCVPITKFVCPPCGSEYYYVKCKWDATYNDCTADYWTLGKVACK